MAEETTAGSRMILENDEPDVKTVRIPLPPQLKADEEQQRETERAAEAVAQAALLQQARKGAGRPAPVKQASPAGASSTTVRAAETSSNDTKHASPERTCPACQTPITPENAAFSFCTHCGADLPRVGLLLEQNAEGKPPVRMALPPEELLANGVRDPRATVRKIAQVHAGNGAAVVVGAGQMQAQQVATSTSAGQIEIEFRREINPTVHALLSFLFPGVGQLLNGQIGKGILLILAAFVAVSLLRLPAFGLELLIARALIGLDAYKIGEKRRNGQKVGEGDWDIA